MGTKSKPKDSQFSLHFPNAFSHGLKRDVKNDSVLQRLGYCFSKRKCLVARTSHFLYLCLIVNTYNGFCFVKGSGIEKAQPRTLLPETI